MTPIIEEKNVTEKLINSIRETYDRLAVDYAGHIFGELAHKPFDRQLLDRFAAEVAPHGPVCDLGCGPGHVALYLRDVGTTVFGVDLSPCMVEQARQLNPSISFQEGNMLALEVANDHLAGIVAFYAIVNFPEESLSLAFREMFRVLQPGGLLMLAFHVGDETLRPTDLWGHAISMDFHLFPVGTIERCLEAAGFVILEVLEREPYPPDVEYQSRRAYVLARKPSSSSRMVSLHSVTGDL